MNYWLVTTEYPPQSGGGISTYSYHTSKMFTQFGHDVTVFIPDGKLKSVRIVEIKDEATLVYFPIKHYDFLGFETGLSFTLSNVLLEHSKSNAYPTVIEFQEYNGIAYYPLQRKWLEEEYFRNTLFLVTAHAPSYLYLEYNQAPSHSFPEYWIGEMEKNVLKSADIVISPSQFLIDTLELNRQETHAIFNPYQLDNVPSSELEVGDIAFFGKLTPQKGGLEMLAYFEQAWQNGKNYRLNIIGGGDHYFYPKKEDLGAYVKKKYANRIVEGLLNFEGHIEPSNLKKRLAKAQAILVPSIVDNLPYTVVEAMAQNKIVLASTDGGHKELIEHGCNGFLFEHDLRNDFLIKLKEILDLKAPEIEAIGEAARSTILSKCGYEAVYKKKTKAITSYREDKTHSFPFLRPEKKVEVNSSSEGTKGLLSVVIPYYNMGDYVNECIASILDNQYKDFEIILVNDGSKDKKSIQKLQELETHKQIKVFNKINTGLSETRNFGAKQATGEFIAFLDPDDSVKPSYYQKAISILNKYSNVSFVGCWAQYFGAKNYTWPSFNPEPPYLLAHNSLNSSAIIIRRIDFLNYGINDSKFVYGMEDYDSIINLVKNGCGGVIIPESLWNYRIREGSLAQSFNKYSKQYLYKLLTKKHASFYSKYASEIINLLNANGPGMNFDNPSKKLGIFHGIQLPFNNSKLMNAIKSNDFLRKIAKSLYSRINS